MQCSSCATTNNRAITNDTDEDLFLAFNAQLKLFLEDKIVKSSDTRSSATDW